MGKEGVILNVLFCLGTAGLSLFAQECMKKGMILGWYGEWLNSTWDTMDRAIWYKYDFKATPIQAKIALFLLKPLGMCIYCFSSWVFIVLFIVESQYFAHLDLNLLDLFYGLGFNFIWIKILEKITT